MVFAENSSKFVRPCLSFSQKRLYKFSVVCYGVVKSQRINGWHFCFVAYGHPWQGGFVPIDVFVFWIANVGFTGTGISNPSVRLFLFGKCHRQNPKGASRNFRQ